MDTELQEIALVKKNLTNEEKMQFDLQFAARRKNPTTALILSLFWAQWALTASISVIQAWGLQSCSQLAACGFGQ